MCQKINCQFVNFYHVDKYKSLIYFFRTIHFHDDQTGDLYSDKMELQILELKKLPANIKIGEDVVANTQMFSTEKCGRKQGMRENYKTTFFVLSTYKVERTE